MKDKTRKPKPPQAYDCTPRVQITFTDEQTWLTRYDTRGAPVATYPVAAQHVANAFRDFGASTGLLPANALWWNARNGRTEIAIWLPPEKRTILYRTGRRVEKYTLPPLGFVFVGEGVQYKIFAAGRRPLMQRDMLYHAPLSNVYQDGGICAGTVKFPRCTVETIGEAARLFFQSEFNGDLGHHRLEGAAGILAGLKELSRKQVFPVERLVPALTVQDLTRCNRAETPDPGGMEPDLEWGDEDDDNEPD